MIDTSRARDELYDVLMDYVASTDAINFCSACPLVEDDGDTQPRCPYSLDVSACEYSPCEELNMFAAALVDALQAMMPN